jgi:hypothetical protein
MVVLKLTDRQAQALVAVLYSGVAAETIRELGLEEVMQPMIKSVGRYIFDRDPLSTLWNPSQTRVVRKDEPIESPDIIINCT